MSDLQLYQPPSDMHSGALVPRPSSSGRDLPARAYPVEPINVSAANPLSEYWEALRRHKFLILIAALVGLGIGVGIASLQPPVYQAHTTIEMQGVNENLMNMKNLDPNAGAEYSTEAYIQTQIRILKSNFLLERVINKLHYDARPEFSGQAQPSPWRQAFHVAPKPVRSNRERMLNSARDRLKVEAVGLTRIVEVSYDSTDPQDAADFLNTLSNEYMQQSIEARGKTTEATSAWLSRQLAETKTKLEASDNALQDYARKTGLIFTSEKDNMAEDKLRQLQISLSQAESDRMAKQAQYEMANASPPESLPEVLNDGSLRDYQQKLADLNRQLAELSSTLTPEHYRVRRVEAQIAELKTTLNQQRSNIVRRIRNEYDAARKRENLLRSQYTGQEGLISNQAGKTTRYNVLKREVESNRQMYDALLQRAKEANVASAVRTSGARVVDPAVPPSTPYKPNTAVNAVIGMLGSLLAAVAFAVIRTRTDSTVQMPGEMTNSLAVPELGLIPAGKGHNLGLVAWEQKGSVMAESFRSVVASMMFSDNPQGQQVQQGGQVLVFTSANAGEGKSTVSSNIGISWAQTGRRVLLIDADTRRPALHTIFGLSNSSGLVDLLQGSEPIRLSSITGLVQPTMVPNLSLLTSGEGSPEFFNLLYSQRLQEFLALCRQNYDVVLIDTPPILQMPDARILGRIAGRVVLVVRSGQTARGAAIFAAHKFNQDRTPILGTILNSFDLGKSSYMYRGYAKY